MMRFVKPMAEAYARAAGYRNMGLRYDDLIQEERDDVQKVGAHYEIFTGTGICD
jgi:ubiquinol-cytochrome c reductase subunit 7